MYRATDSVLERTVAVKLLSEWHAREPEIRTRFEREALAAARLSGTPHVITVFDVGTHGGRPLIVMEYMDGGSIHDRLRAGGITHEQALQWLEHAAEALDRAHALGIVHRDVKPANLLLDREGDVQVSDFGVASATGLDTLTIPGSVLGTAGYLAPEQARGEPVTPASDRYALGVVAFELLTGRRPFESDTAATEAFAHVSAPLPSAREVAPGLPPALDAVFARALAKDPADRPGSCAELVGDLRSALGPAPAPNVVQTGTPTRRMVRKTGSRSPVVPVFAVAALVLLGLVTATLVGAVDDPDPRTRTIVSTTVETVEAPRAPTVVSVPPVDGAALNDQGFELMQAGQFEEALPLLRRAVGALAGSGSLTEAFASYNLAFTRFAVGRCDGVLGLLDRSERVQGDRREIDDLRDEWDERCSPADDDPGRGKGNGKGKGNGNDSEGGED